MKIGEDAGTHLATALVATILATITIASTSTIERVESNFWVAAVYFRVACAAMRATAVGDGV